MVFNQKLSFSEDCLSSEGVFHRSLSSMGGHLPWKVVFHTRKSSIKGCFSSILSSIKGCLQSKIVFLQRSSSIKGQRSSSIKGYLQLKFIFNCMSSSSFIEGSLTSKVVFYWYEQSVFQSVAIQAVDCLFLS